MRFEPLDVPDLRHLEIAVDRSNTPDPNGESCELLALGPGRALLLHGAGCVRTPAESCSPASLGRLAEEYGSARASGPGPFLTRLNREPRDSQDPHKFSLLFAGEFDDDERRVAFASAGVDVLLLRGGGDVEGLEPDMPLGLAEHVFESQSIPLAPGDQLVFPGLFVGTIDGSALFDDRELAALRALQGVAPGGLAYEMNRQIREGTPGSDIHWQVVMVALVR